ncbi:MAG TPA: hypothetical protein VJ110_01060 [Candidatus Nanoarchaeia archaeon]|nr:hypothetical protein [Candidatus Nanoarchaeia archaeon]
MRILLYTRPQSVKSYYNLTSDLFQRLAPFGTNPFVFHLKNLILPNVEYVGVGEIANGFVLLDTIKSSQKTEDIAPDLTRMLRLHSILLTQPDLRHVGEVVAQQLNLSYEGMFQI